MQPTNDLDGGHVVLNHGHQTRMRFFVTVGALVMGVAGLLPGCGESTEVLLERARATETPCDERTDISAMSLEQYRQVEEVRRRRCDEQRCAAFNEALGAADTASIRTAIAAFRTIPPSPISCAGVTEAEAALATVNLVRNGAESVPPRWGEAWQALKTMPSVPGSSRATFLSDELIQQVVLGCFEEARRQHESAFSQANWTVAIEAARLAVECARAQTDGAVTDEQVQALEQRSENAQLCSVLANATGASSWASAIPALEGVEQATAATRLSSSDRSSISRALRRARSNLNREEQASRRAARRCDYANERADRCNEICGYRYRGADRCFDMCERRYPGCDGPGADGGDGEPVLGRLEVAICDSANTVEVAEARTSPDEERPRMSNRRRRPSTERREVSVGDFE